MRRVPLDIKVHAPADLVSKWPPFVYPRDGEVCVQRGYSYRGAGRHDHVGASEGMGEEKRTKVTADALHYCKTSPGCDLFPGG